MLSSNHKNKIGNDYSLAKLFVATLRQFFESTSLHGFKYLVQSKRSPYEKIIWYLIQICALAAAVYIFLYALDGFSSKPTFTSLESVRHPVWKIPFPAVAVCSVNKISKKGAWKYAQELSKKTQNYTVEWLFEQIRHLGHMFDFDLDMYNEYVKFQDLLDIIDLNNESKVYDTQSTFEFKISPQCEDLLVRCSWGDSVVDCMSIFKFRKTRDGYCCLFNYVRQFNTLSDKDVVLPMHTGFTGPDSGLIVLVNTTTSDYYFQLGSRIGFNVLVFNPSDFADNQNGGLAHLFVSPNTETFFKIDASTIKANPAVEQYAPAQRGCLFEHELFKQYAGHYSYVDCLLKCKLHSIIALCGCMPFFLPTNFPDGTTSPVKCTLEHNKCLNRYKTTVNSFWPYHLDHDESNKFIEDAIECPECLPICTKTNFRVSATYSKLLQSAMEQSRWALFENLSTFLDISVVHVYYPFVATTLYRADVVMTWQEIVSSFGGLLGLCLGFSLVSLVEFGYFATVRLYQNIPIAFNRSEDDDLEKWHAENFKENLRKSEVFSRRLREIYVNDFARYHRPLNENRI